MSKMEKQHFSEKQSLVKNNIALESECSKLKAQISQLEER